MSLHTSLRLLRAATTFIHHCWSPSTLQPEMHLVGNASTWAEAFKVIRADGDHAALSSVSGRKLVLLPPKRHGLSLQAAKGTVNMESLDKSQVTVGKVTVPASMCAQTGCSSWPSPCSPAQAAGMQCEHLSVGSSGRFRLSITSWSQRSWVCLKARCS